MIQDIYEKFNVEFKNINPKEDDYILYFKDNCIFLINDNIPKLKDCDFKNIRYLFSIGKKSYFISFKLNDLSKGSLKQMTDVRTHHDSVDRFAIITARHLNEWYYNNKYCGRCGKLLSYDSKERAMRCECGNIVYPRINPAVIVAITNKDKILLTKYAKGNPRYALVAGFTEIGESFEDTVKREVMEEVGLNVTNIKYFKSQPWGLTGSVLAGYYCEVVGNDIPDISSGELKEATWFSKKELDEFDISLSLTNTMIENFRNSK